MYLNVILYKKNFDFQNTDNLRLMTFQTDKRHDLTKRLTKYLQNITIQIDLKCAGHNTKIQTDNLTYD